MYTSTIRYRDIEELSVKLDRIKRDRVEELIVDLQAMLSNRWLSETFKADIMREIRTLRAEGDRLAEILKNI